MPLVQKYSEVLNSYPSPKCNRSVVLLQLYLQKNIGEIGRGQTIGERIMIARVWCRTSPILV
jgi:hypothetical protein